VPIHRSPSPVHLGQYRRRADEPDHLERYKTTRSSALKPQSFAAHPFLPAPLKLSHSTLTVRRGRARRRRLRSSWRPWRSSFNTPDLVEHPGGAEHQGEPGEGGISAFPFPRVRRESINRHHLRQPSTSPTSPTSSR
jgi:hypothetical protein